MVCGLREAGGGRREVEGGLRDVEEGRAEIAEFIRAVNALHGRSETGSMVSVGVFVSRGHFGKTEDRQTDETDEKYGSQEILHSL